LDDAHAHVNAGANASLTPRVLQLLPPFRNLVPRFAGLTTFRKKQGRRYEDNLLVPR
jgi:hypothetical protein